MYQAGKLDNLRKKVERVMLDVVRVNEVRWTGSEQVESGGWTLYYSGGERHEAGVGVGVMMRREVADAVVGVWQVSERVILVKIDAKPNRMNIIQVYAKTSDHSDDEVDNFSKQVDSVRGRCKSEVDIDMKAMVGEGHSGNVVENFCLGERNERGDRWLELCESWEPVIMNTLFWHHPRHLYTWRGPGDRVRN